MRFVRWHLELTEDGARVLSKIERDRERPKEANPAETPLQSGLGYYLGVVLPGWQSSQAPVV